MVESSTAAIETNDLPWEAPIASAPTIHTRVHILGDVHITYHVADGFETVEMRTDPSNPNGEADVLVSLRWIDDRYAFADELEAVARAIRAAS